MRSFSVLLKYQIHGNKLFSSVFQRLILKHVLLSLLKDKQNAKNPSSSVLGLRINSTYQSYRPIFLKATSDCVCPP